GDKPEPLFFGALGRALARAARERGVPAEKLSELAYQEHGGAPDMGDDRTGVDGADQTLLGYSLESLEDDLHVLLQYWQSAVAPKQPRVVFQVDEISRFSLMSYGSLLQFRSLFITDPRVKAVLSGKLVDRTRDTPQDSPWWNFLGKEIEVEPLTPDEART